MNLHFILSIPIFFNSRPNNFLPIPNNPCPIPYNICTRPYNSCTKPYNSCTIPNNPCTKPNNLCTRPYNPCTRPNNPCPKPNIKSPILNNFSPNQGYQELISNNIRVNRYRLKQILLSRFRIESIPQSFPNQIVNRYGNKDADPRKNHQPPRRKLFPPFGQ